MVDYLLLLIVIVLIHAPLSAASSPSGESLNANVGEETSTVDENVAKSLRIITALVNEVFDTESTFNDNIEYAIARFTVNPSAKLMSLSEPMKKAPTQLETRSKKRSWIPSFVRSASMPSMRAAPVSSPNRRYSFTRSNQARNDALREAKEVPITDEDKRIFLNCLPTTNESPGALGFSDRALFLFYPLLKFGQESVPYTEQFYMDIGDVFKQIAEIIPQLTPCVEASHVKTALAGKLAGEAHLFGYPAGTLGSLAIEPVQRPPRYLLFVKEFIKYMTKLVEAGVVSSDALTNLQEAQTLLENEIRALNSML